MSLRSGSWLDRSVQILLHAPEEKPSQLANGQEDRRGLGRQNDIVNFSP